ncbi:MAG: hypothetical protein WA210_13595, partial [Burkholderiaceae bacterium]
MPGVKPSNRIARRRAVPASVRLGLRPADEVSDLAWAGQHAQAITLASTALGSSGLDADSRIELLDLRAESHIAQADLLSAGLDAAAMQQLARRTRSAEHAARAFNRQALVHLRSGE